jgi:hypothetical protein
MCSYSIKPAMTNQEPLHITDKFYDDEPNQEFSDLPEWITSADQEISKIQESDFSKVYGQSGSNQFIQNLNHCLYLIDDDIVDD